MSKESKQRSGILIDDKYGIVTLPIDYALAKVRTDEKGVYFVPFAYFGSVKRCLTEYVKQAVHDDLTVDSAISLNEAIKTIDGAFRRSAQALETSFPAFEVVER